MNNNFDEILFHVDATLLDCQKNKITTEKIIILSVIVLQQFHRKFVTITIMIQLSTY